MADLDAFLTSTMPRLTKPTPHFTPVTPVRADGHLVTKRPRDLVRRRGHEMAFPLGLGGGPSRPEMARAWHGEGHSLAHLPSEMQLCVWAILGSNQVRRAPLTRQYAL